MIDPALRIRPSPDTNRRLRTQYEQARTASLAAGTVPPSLNAWLSGLLSLALDAIEDSTDERITA
jgi:hypothetical protein